MSKSEKRNIQIVAETESKYLTKILAQRETHDTQAILMIKI